MAKNDNLFDFIEDVARGICTAEGQTFPFTINPQNFRSRIEALKKVSGTKTITSSGTHDVANYEKASVAAGALTASGSASANFSVNPGTVTISAPTQAVNGKTQIALTPTTATTGIGTYYVALKASAAAGSGTGSISGTATAKASTAGYLAQNSSATSSISGTATASVNKKDSSIYYAPIASGTYTVSGGGLTSGAGTVSAAGTGITLGTATTTKPTSGNYIKVTGSGKVSMAAVTATQTAGYLPAATTAKTLVSAVSNKSSNTATAYYPISSNIVDTSSGDATAAHILKDKKAWVDGKEVTGSIVEQEVGEPIEGMYWNNEDEDNFIFWGSLEQKTAFESEVDLAIPRGDFGDITADYVPDIFTFTSQEGVNIQGQMPYYDGRVLSIDENSIVDYGNTLEGSAYVIEAYIDESVEQDRRIDKLCVEGSVIVSMPIPNDYTKPSGTKTITSSGTHDVKEYANASVAEGSYTLSGGGLTGGGDLTPTVSFASGSDTNMSNISIGAKNTTNYPYYFKVNATSTSGSKTITRAAVTATQSAGYLAGTTTAINKISSGTATVNVKQGSGNTYVNIPSASVELLPITVSSAGVITAKVDMEDSTSGYFKTDTSKDISITKTLTTKAGGTIYPSTTATQTWAKNTYLTSTLTVPKEANLVASNIKSGITICGVTGNYEGASSGSEAGQKLTLTTNGTLTDNPTITVTYTNAVGMHATTTLTNNKTLVIYIYPGYSVSVAVGSHSGMFSVATNNMSYEGTNNNGDIYEPSDGTSSCKLSFYYAS